MTADAHLHLFRHGYRPASAPGLPSDVDAYERHMQEHAIEAGLVVCYEGEGIDPTNNGHVRALAATRPWIRSVAYLDPPPPSAQRIEALLDAGHMGIALYLPDAASATLLCGWPADIWEWLNRACAIISLNARPEAIARLSPVVESASECALLFSHLGLPGRDDNATAAEAEKRLEPLLALSGSRNVGVKVSGLYAIDPVAPNSGAQPYVELVLSRFAASNVHWGSDFSPSLEFGSFSDTMAVPGLQGLDERERRLLFGEGLMSKIRRAERSRQG